MVQFTKIYLSYPRNELCPCESKNKAKDCCLKGNEWDKLPANVVPKSPKTDFENKKCYASVTENCVSKISREHYISQCVLKVINKGGNKVKVKGLSWIPGKDQKSIATANLVASNLCKRHNEALSPLDKEAARFFKTLDSYDKGFKEPNPTEEIKVFCGEDFERWLLKTSIGILQSGQLKNDGEPLKPELNSNIIKILYGQYNWPKGWGLYLAEDKITYLSSFGCVPIIDRDKNKLIGMKFRINNFVYNLAFALREDSREIFGIYRPKTLVFTNGTVKKYIELSWQNKANKHIVELTRSKKKTANLE